MKTAAMPPDEVKPPAIQEFLSSFLHQRSVFIPSLAPQGRLHEKNTLSRAFFMEAPPGLDAAAWHWGMLAHARHRNSPSASRLKLGSNTA